MKTLLQAGALVQQIFERRDWTFCFIGGVANFRWGTPRLTNDLDLTLLTGFGTEATYAAALLTEFESRISDATAFALQNRVLNVRDRVRTRGLPVDEIGGVLRQKRGAMGIPWASFHNDRGEEKNDRDALCTRA